MSGKKTYTLVSDTEESGRTYTGSLNSAQIRRQFSSLGTSASTTYHTSSSSRGVDEIPCYIVNKNTGKTVELLFTPETISDTFSSNFDPTDIRGRSSPHQNYTSSGGREISFSIVLYQDYCDKGLVNTVNALKAMAYPFYGATILPPRVYFRVGNFIKMEAACTSVSVEWQKPYKEGVYSKADVSITLQEIEQEAKGAKEVECSGFAGGGI